MLSAHREQLKGYRFVLASGSKSRRDYITTITGLDVESISSTFEEDLKPEDFPTHEAFLEKTALEKVEDVERTLKASNSKDSRPYVIIGADTMVVLDGVMKGKPENKEQAERYILNYKGKAHQVKTGVVIKSQRHGVITFTEVTNVHFGDYSEEQAKGYVTEEDTSNFAGGYGIQGLAGSLIKKIDGDYYNVLGLPAHQLCLKIIEMINSK